MADRSSCMGSEAELPKLVTSDYSVSSLEILRYELVAQYLHPRKPVLGSMGHCLTQSSATLTDSALHLPDALRDGQQAYLIRYNSIRCLRN